MPKKISFFVYGEEILKDSYYFYHSKVALKCAIEAMTVGTQCSIIIVAGDIPSDIPSHIPSGKFLVMVMQKGLFANSEFLYFQIKAETWIFSLWNFPQLGSASFSFNYENSISKHSFEIGLSFELPLPNWAFLMNLSSIYLRKMKTCFTSVYDNKLQTSQMFFYHTLSKYPVVTQFIKFSYFSIFRDEQLTRIFQFRSEYLSRTSSY